ncbi:MAG TPA: LptF/LptG family permease [Planctomycetota bacterium]|nr:LptF/LptG family permease [Planctomycetota bacterium]
MRVTLDRYVGRSVAASWLASLLFFLFLGILLDLLNGLPEYLDRADKQGVSAFGMFGFLGRYYLATVPAFYTMLAPFVTVIACMFAVARFMAQNELAPMLFTGRSMRRILQPALCAGALAGLLMVACWQWGIPAMRESLATVASVVTGGNVELKSVVIEQRGERREQLYAGKYDHRTRTMSDLMLLVEGPEPDDATLVKAATGVWDPAAGDWRLTGGYLERAGKDGRPGTGREISVLGAGQFTPERVWQQGKEGIEPDALTYDELLDLHRLRPNRADVLMALHRHITYPLANVILLLLALPFAVHYERGSRIERVLSAIAVCVAYLVVDLICQSLGHREFLHPVMAAWIPTILFGSLGVVMFGAIRT